MRWVSMTIVGGQISRLACFSYTKVFNLRESQGVLSIETQYRLVAQMDQEIEFDVVDTGVMEFVQSLPAGTDLQALANLRQSQICSPVVNASALGSLRLLTRQHNMRATTEAALKNLPWEHMMCEQGMTEVRVCANVRVFWPPR